MSGAQTSNDAGTDATGTTAIPMRFEVMVIPVSDVDRAKDFYQGLGWRLDADFDIEEGYRVLQFTPPGSPTSIIFGTGTTTMDPGSLEELVLVVDDLDAARDELIARGVDVSEIWHGRGFGGIAADREPGPDPEGGSYKSFASFADPDGNGWQLQEIKERLPGRV